MTYDEAKRGLIESIQLGLTVEAEDARLSVPTLTTSEIEWLAAWLAGEGWVKT